jgi:hypothetical protein
MSKKEEVANTFGLSSSAINRMLKLGESLTFKPLKPRDKTLGFSVLWFRMQKRSHFPFIVPLYFQ